MNIIVGLSLFVYIFNININNSGYFSLLVTYKNKKLKTWLFWPNLAYLDPSDGVSAKLETCMDFPAP